MVDLTGFAPATLSLQGTPSTIDIQAHKISFMLYYTRSIVLN